MSTDPILPSKFGKIVEKMDAEVILEDALAAASALARKRRRGDNKVKSSDIRQSVGTTVTRLRVFAVHGCKCDSCGLEGSEILHTVDKGGGHHIDLYAVKNGRYVLMNRDHILPASKGGPNHLWNLRPMCEPCNSKRGNTYTEEDKKLYKFRVRWSQWGNRLFRHLPFLTDRAIYWLAKIFAKYF